MTKASPSAIVVPLATVCLSLAASERTQLDISTETPLLLIISTNSSFVILTVPSPFASPVEASGSAKISLITKTGVVPVVAFAVIIVPSVL